MPAFNNFQSNALSMKFKEWFSDNLKVGRFPLPAEIRKMDADIIINVSDEYIPSCHNAATNSNKQYFWFPMNECRKIEVQSIFGAMQILYLAEKEGKKVFLHCHAGINRSRIIQGCYWLMQNGTPPVHPALAENIEQNFLPPLETINLFLWNCKQAFELPDTLRGGQLDACKIRAGI